MDTFGGMPFEDDVPLDDALLIEFTGNAPLRQKTRKGRACVELSDENVKAAVCGEQETWVRDTLNPSLCLRLHPTGGKSYWAVDLEGDFRERRRVWLAPSSMCSVALARLNTDRELAAARYGRQTRRKTKILRRNIMVDALVTEYLKDFPPGASEWFKRKATLLESYVIPRFGDRLLPRVAKQEWENLIDETVLTHRSQGAHLSKTLKSFLSWAVEGQVLSANPLGRYEPELPPKPPQQKAYLDIDALVAIYTAATQLGQPWSTMIGLVIVTGEAIEHIRKMKVADIDWRQGTWVVKWNESGGGRGPRRQVELTGEAIDLLTPYRNVSGYLFRSPRCSGEEQPINFYAEMFGRLKTDCGVKNAWGMRDLRHAIRREIEGMGGGATGLAVWSSKFRSEVQRSWHEEPDEVVL